jgi:hypothetical protein
MTLWLSIRSDHMPVHWLFRPISIAVATWSRVEDGFDNTPELHRILSMLWPISSASGQHEGE